MWFICIFSFQLTNFKINWWFIRWSNGLWDQFDTWLIVDITFILFDQLSTRVWHIVILYPFIDSRFQIYIHWLNWKYIILYITYSFVNFSTHMDFYFFHLDNWFIYFIYLAKRVSIVLKFNNFVWISKYLSLQNIAKIELD